MSENEEKKQIKVVLDKETAKELEKAKLELADAQDKVTQYEAEKAQSALEQFEKDKKELLDIMKESGTDSEKITYVSEHVQTPKDLEFVKNYTVKTIEKLNPPPKGKASIDAPPRDTDKLATNEAYIEQLYKQARLSSDPQERKKADAMIDKLWSSLSKNPSWSKLHEDEKAGKTSGKSIVDLAISRCPKCGSANESSKGPFLAAKSVTCVKCGNVYVV